MLKQHEQVSANTRRHIIDFGFLPGEHVYSRQHNRNGVVCTCSFVYWADKSIANQYTVCFPASEEGPYEKHEIDEVWLQEGHSTDVVID